MTIQAAADECDINVMIARYQRTGSFVDPLSSPSVPPNFGDFGTSIDYQDALNYIIDAQSSFDALPASVRDRFANEPAKLLAFLEDVSNRPEAIKLGLIPEPVVEKADS